MRLAILLIPFVLAAGQASAEHDRHHRSVPRITGEIRLDRVQPEQTASVSEPVAASLQAESPAKAERPRVRVVLPSPFAR